MITVHHLDHSRSQRVLWLLEELGVPYEVVRYARDPVTMRAPAALRAVHPLGKSPVIADGEVTLAESGAIVEYLVGRHGGGRLRPAEGTPEHVRYLHRLHFAEGSLMPLLFLALVFKRVPKNPMPFFAKPIARGISEKVVSSFVMPQVSQQLDYLEDELRKSEWFAGAEFTAADIQMSYPIEAIAKRAGLGEGRTKLAAWVEKVQARPAYKKAEARVGTFGVPT